MSYDFNMKIDTGSGKMFYLYEDINYTYNVSAMYRKAFQDDEGINILHRMKGIDCIPLIESAINSMQIDADNYRLMNPPNGWGNYEGALNVLVKILEWCKESPCATFNIG